MRNKLPINSLKFNNANNNNHHNDHNSNSNAIDQDTEMKDTTPLTNNNTNTINNSSSTVNNNMNPTSNNMNIIPLSSSIVVNNIIVPSPQKSNRIPKKVLPATSSSITVKQKPHTNILSIRKENHQ